MEGYKDDELYLIIGADNIINFEDIREFSDDFKEIIKLFY